jgi:hypothetical protein
MVSAAVLAPPTRWLATVTGVGAALPDGSVVGGCTPSQHDIELLVGNVLEVAAQIEHLDR